MWYKAKAISPEEKIAAITRHKMEKKADHDRAETEEKAWPSKSSGRRPPSASSSCGFSLNAARNACSAAFQPSRKTVLPLEVNR